VAASTEQHTWLPRNFVDRIGAALAAPRRALTVADTEEAAGKAGSDAALLILLSFVAVHTSEVVVAGWLTKTEGIRVGLTAVAGSLSRSLGIQLVVLFAAGVSLTLAAGRRRSLGRDFDLACVVFVPYLVVGLGAQMVTRLAGMQPPAILSQIVTVGAYAWAMFVWVLAVQHARGRGDE